MIDSDDYGMTCWHWLSLALGIDGEGLLARSTPETRCRAVAQLVADGLRPGNDGSEWLWVGKVDMHAWRGWTGGSAGGQ
jgi:hypothetical protein